MKQFKIIITVFVTIVFIICSITIVHAKRVKISKESSDIHFGVRIYAGYLPEDIKYESLGRIEAEGHGGMAVEALVNARLTLCAKARQLGANAILDIRTEVPVMTLIASGEAIIAESFPDEYTEADFAGFKGPKEFSNSKIFKYEYNGVFNAIVEVLEGELYAIEKEEFKTGTIETVPMEISNGKRGIITGGPYPILKLLINIEKASENETKVTENYIFLKGTVWHKNFLIKSNEIFFSDIKKKIKKNLRNKM